MVSSLMCTAGYAALFIAKDERTMHDVQRIFYRHILSVFRICLRQHLSFIHQQGKIRGAKAGSRRR